MSDRQLTSSNFDSINPDVNGFSIVYQREFNNGARSSVYVYNLRGDGEKLISDSNFDARFPKVSANTIVWQQWDGNDWEIWKSSLDGSNRMQLTFNDLDDTTPVVDGNNILFQRRVNRVPTSNLTDLYVYDINAARFNPIASSPTGFTSLDISGDNLVWEEGQSSSIVAATITNSGIIRKNLNIGGSVISQPSISNNIVVFKQEITTGNTILRGLNYYDINSGNYFNLIGNRAFEPQRDNPQISNNNVVWQQLIGSRNSEIWTQTINGAGATRLTNYNLEDINPRISGDNVVWQRFDSNHYQIAYDSLIGLSAPVYRFYNPVTGGHFYTADISERNSLLNRANSNYNYEGIVFQASQEADSRLSPVYRFYNPARGVHFYTIDPAERDTLVNNVAQLGYVSEGIGFYAYGSTSPQGQDVYRYYNTITGAHFFTLSLQERDSVLSNPQWGYISEGVGFRAA